MSVYLNKDTIEAAVRNLITLNSLIEKKFRNTSKEISQTTKEKINKIKEIVYLKYNQGYKIGCFTASSKGNTLLNCLNFKKKVIQFASENNKKKIGKYTPGSHIKIISDKDFNKKRIDYAILLSWNYKKFFLSKTQFIKEGGKFIIPLPAPHIK